MKEEKLIKRCINNIIDNSLKYGEQIDVNLKKLRKELVIKIEDDGPGIPKMRLKMFLNLFIKLIKVDLKLKIVLVLVYPYPQI